MSRRRVFHAPGAWAVGQRLQLDDAESHYLLRVRRAGVGTPVEVLDGTSAQWQAELVAIEDRRAVVELQAAMPTVSVPTRVLLLVVPDPRATLEALTVASELGVTEVCLVTGDHSPGAIPSRERLDRTLRAAQRQCGRPQPPVVHGPEPLVAALERTAAHPGYVASVRDRHGPAPSLPVGAASARLLVGPEGGLSDDEMGQAVAAGLHPLGLGPWVLRTPTAVAAGLARLLAHEAG